MLWNLVSDYFEDSCSFKQFYRKVQSDPKFRNSNLLVYENYNTFCIVIFFTFKSDYPFDVFYAFLFEG